MLLYCRLSGLDLRFVSIPVSATGGLPLTEGIVYLLPHRTAFAEKTKGLVPAAPSRFSSRAVFAP